jgi:hypothetical protein
VGLEARTTARVSRTTHLEARKAALETNTTALETWITALEARTIANISSQQGHELGVRNWAAICEALP